MRVRFLPTGRGMSQILALASALALFAPAIADDQPQSLPDQGGYMPPPDDAQSQAPPPSSAPRLSKPLQGGVEQTGLRGEAQGAGLRGGVQGTGLTGGAQGTGLTGGAQDGGWQGNPQQGRLDQGQPGPPLQGSAQRAPMALNAFDDPDAGNQELMIDWDMWRNTLMQAIQNGTLGKINVQNDINFVWDPRSQMMISRYPDGTSAWYALDVLPNRTIINVRLTSHSRYPSYDQAVVQAIMDLQGNPILQYPRGSRRRIVSQESNVRTASQTQFQQQHFGDVETQRW